MISFKQYATLDEASNVIPNDIGRKLLQITKFMHQATPKNLPYLVQLWKNANGSICWGLQYPSNDTVPCSDYINDELFEKIVHYNEWEFKWVDGVPVKRPQPLVAGLTVRGEMADAYAAINFRPTSLVTYLFKRIETVFGVDLDLL